MKKYTVSFGGVLDLSEHKHPERTAYRMGVGLDFDCYCQVWSNRAAMARSIRMQEKHAARADWRPIVSLTDGEGY